MANCVTMIGEKLLPRLMCRLSWTPVQTSWRGISLACQISPTFAQQVLHITERKRKTNVQHDCKSDDLRAGFKVAEWRVFCN